MNSTRPDTVLSDPDFRRILGSSLVSHVGSYLLTLALATYVYLESHSAIAAGWIFIFSYLPSALGSSVIGRAIDRRLGRGLLIGADFLAAGASAACGILVQAKAPLLFVGLLLAFRSLLMFTTRAAGLKWVKETSPPAFLVKRNQLLGLTYLLSSAIAGGIAAGLLDRNQLPWIVGIDVATYFVSMSLCLGLRGKIAPAPDSASSPADGGVLSTLQEILGNPALRRPFLLTMLSTALFQSAGMCLVTLLPISRFQLGGGGTGWYQIAYSVGVLLGFLLIWMKPTILTAAPLDRLPRAPLGFALTLVLLIATGLSLRLGPSLGWITLFMLATIRTLRMRFITM